MPETAARSTLLRTSDEKLSLERECSSNIFEEHFLHLCQTQGVNGRQRVKRAQMVMRQLCMYVCIYIYISLFIDISAVELLSGPCLAF